ncbi:FtsW/RodA/SpoVE family cell cycle protein [Bacillota bacterium LX-D]|nr:FtsW/RodA/SpoVE family cell cycle protein [Bacillota bacterium LX-D]
MMKILRRPQEALLLFLVTLVIMFGALLFKLTTPEYSKQLFLGALILVITFFLIHFLLSWVNPAADELLLPLAAMLSTLGLLAIFRIDPDLAIRQWLWLMLSLLAFGIILVFFKNYQVLSEYKYVFMVLGIIFLLITVILGTKIGGSRAWLQIGSFRFQPAELVKLLVIFFLASYLRDTKEILMARKNYGFFALPEPRAIVPLLLMSFMSLGLLALQKDLGAAMIFFGIFLVMLYTSTGRGSFLLIGLGFFSLGTIAAYHIFGHFRLRVLIWLDPWNHVDRAYQITQSLFAIASGGMFGTGMGLGLPEAIPAAETDLIFSVLTEQLGLLGGICLIILFLLLGYRGFKAAMRADNEFGLLLATGLTTLLSLQSFVIISGVLKLLPLTGVTLPFVSYGGSSLIISYILLGLVMNVGSSAEEVSA